MHGFRRILPDCVEISLNSGDFGEEFVSGAATGRRTQSEKMELGHFGANSDPTDGKLGRKPGPGCYVRDLLVLLALLAYRPFLHPPSLKSIDSSSVEPRGPLPMGGNPSIPGWPYPMVPSPGLGVDSFSIR